MYLPLIEKITAYKKKRSTQLDELSENQLIDVSYGSRNKTVYYHSEKPLPASLIESLASSGKGKHYFDF